MLISPLIGRGEAWMPSRLEYINNFIIKPFKGSFCRILLCFITTLGDLGAPKRSDELQMVITKMIIDNICIRMISLC